MTEKLTCLEGTGVQSSGSARYYLQKRGSDDFWSGERWEAGIDDAEFFLTVDSALECAHSLSCQAVDFVAMFLETSARITIPLGALEAWR